MIDGQKKSRPSAHPSNHVLVSNPPQSLPFLLVLTGGAAHEKILGNHPSSRQSIETELIGIDGLPRSEAHWIAIQFSFVPFAIAAELS
jgi:hypothetical protein